MTTAKSVSNELSNSELTNVHSVTAELLADDEREV